MTTICRVFIPFAAGLYLSFLFRVINALIAPHLSQDLGIGAAGLGTMTSIFFLAFAVSQLFVGWMLDHYGPRRVQAGLLLIGALGVILFAIGGNLWSLTFARALIAMGFSASLASGVKAIVTWLPQERVSLANGWLLALGALGAISATGPSNIIMQSFGWRGLLGFLALLTLAISALIYFVVPDAGSPAGPGGQNQALRLTKIFRNRDFLRIAPVTSLSVSVPWAMQGLWATPWLRDVDGYSHTMIVAVLFAMGGALCAGGVVLGSLAHRLAPRGITTDTVFGWAVAALLIVEMAILANAPLPPYVLWGALSFFGSLPALGFAIMSERFAKAVMGRVSSAFVMLNFATAFAVQAGMGYILALWPGAGGGHSPAAAYDIAFAAPCVLQGAAFAWFLRSNSWRVSWRVSWRAKAASLVEPIQRLRIERIQALPPCQALPPRDG
jgi:predicted MFS family arabinose efflux permease